MYPALETRSRELSGLTESSLAVGYACQCIKCEDDKIVHTHTLPRRPRPVLSKDIHSHFLPFELWNWVEFTNDKQTIVNVAIALLLSSGLLVCLPALA